MCIRRDLERGEGRFGPVPLAVSNAGIVSEKKLQKKKSKFRKKLIFI